MILHPDDALTVTTWSGNQPPRRETCHAVVVEPCGGGAWIRYEDGPRAGRQTRVSGSWLARHARRPPGPDAAWPARRRGPAHPLRPPGDRMNTPPPDDMKKTYTTLPKIADSEAEIAKDAPAARNAVARRFPGEAGTTETDTGKSLWDVLGIGKEKK